MTSNKIDNDPFVSISQAAEAAQVPLRTLYGWAARGRISAEHPQNGQTLVRVGEVRAHAERRRAAGDLAPARVSRLPACSSAQPGVPGNGTALRAGAAGTLVLAASGQDTKPAVHAVADEVARTRHEVELLRLRADADRAAHDLDSTRIETTAASRERAEAALEAQAARELREVESEIAAQTARLEVEEKRRVAAVRRREDDLRFVAAQEEARRAAARRAWLARWESMDMPALDRQHGGAAAAAVRSAMIELVARLDPVADRYSFGQATIAETERVLRPFVEAAERVRAERARSALVNSVLSSLCSGASAPLATAARAAAEQAAAGVDPKSFSARDDVVAAVRGAIRDDYRRQEEERRREQLAREKARCLAELPARIARWLPTAATSAEREIALQRLRDFVDANAERDDLLIRVHDAGPRLLRDLEQQCLSRTG